MQTMLLLIILILIGVQNFEPLLAQSYAQDTVWTRKTDQSDGFYKVKFSDNDSIIVGLGYNDNLFFDATNGNEIKRIPGSNEPFFFNNDKNYIKLNYSLNRFEIFDFETLEMIDTLEHDNTKIYAISDLNDNKRFLASIIQGGICLWDINTKKIISNIIFPIEPYVTKFNVGHVEFTCNNNIICTEYKEYFNPEDNSNWADYKIELYDFISLERINTFENYQEFRMSHNCELMAFKIGNPSYGVEVYNFNTKELIWKIPVNGPSSTGIEFSPDDKYLVTSPWIQIWDIESKGKIISYQSGSARNISISHNGKFIFSTIGEYLYKWYARWQGVTVEEGEENPIIIYPNPTNGILNIDFFQPLPEPTTINLNDINGVFIRNLFNNLLEPGQQNINLNVSDLANGTYFVNVNNSQLSLVFKLIINK